MAKRQSNLELLRIIAMMMIIVLHFFNSDRRPATGSENELVYYLYESLSICGVNLFVLLTGFFSLNQTSVRIRKVIDLVITVAFWEFVGFLLCVAAGRRAFHLKELIRTMFPIFFGGRWFVKAYIILLFFIPFINIVLRSISKRSYWALLGIQLFMFSFWPFFLPNPPFDDYGYSFVHFITLYILIGYFRLHVKKYPPKWLCMVGYFFCFGVILIYKIRGIGYEWAYNSPFVIAEAVFLFLFFAQIQIKSEWINRLAGCAFGVYLVHTNAYFTVMGYERLFHGSSVVNGSINRFLLCVPACVLFFYFFGFVMESVKKILFSYTVDPALERIPLLNCSIDVEDAAGSV